MRLMRGRDLICRRGVAVVGVFTGYVLGINALRIILGESLNSRIAVHSDLPREHEKLWKK